MSFKNDYINKNYNRLKAISDKFIVKDREDIFNESILYFLEMDDDKVNKLITEGEASKYIIGIFKINCFSKTSPYQRKYFNIDKMLDYTKERECNYTKEPDEEEEEVEVDDDLCWYDFIRILDGLDVYFLDKLLYKQYIETKINQTGYSIKKLADEFELSESTLRKKFSVIKDKIKKVHGI